MTTMASTLTREDWWLLTKGHPHSGSWWLLTLLGDFKQARADTVAGWGGGSYTWMDGETSGWYQTTKDGIGATKGGIAMHNSKPDAFDHFLTWKRIETWSRSRTDEERETAKALRVESQEIARTYPVFKASKDAIGCGPHKGVPTEARALYEAEWQAWHDGPAAEHHARRREHEVKLVAFCKSLAPTALDDLIIAMNGGQAA